MSWFSSGLGVVFPTLIPTVAGVAQAVGGGVNPIELCSMVVVGGTVTGVSPFSTTGALIVATAMAEEGKYDQAPRTVFVLRRCIVHHRSVQALAYGSNTGYHSVVPIALSQVGNHVFGLYAFADGIGQIAFEPIAGIELYTSLVGNKQNDQTVVFALFAYSPFV